jgi:hypothetical protein
VRHDPARPVLPLLRVTARAPALRRLIPKLAAALALNTCCLELKLCDNMLTDGLVSMLAT